MEEFEIRQILHCEFDTSHITYIYGSLKFILTCLARLDVYLLNFAPFKMALKLLLSLTISFLNRTENVSNATIFKR